MLHNRLIVNKSKPFILFQKFIAGYLILTEACLMFQTEGVLWNCVQGALRRSPHQSPPVQALLSEEARTTPATGTGWWWGGGGGGRAGNRKECSEHVPSIHNQRRRGGRGERAAR